MEGTAGRGLHETLQPSAPIVSAENEGDEFETSPATFANFEIYPRPYSDPSAPPSYEAALDAAKSAPYPLSDHMGMPWPTGAVASTDFLPYPAAVRQDMHPLPSQIGLFPQLSNEIESVTPPSNRRVRRVPYRSSFDPPVRQPPARPSSETESLTPSSNRRIPYQSAFNPPVRQPPARPSSETESLTPSSNRRISYRSSFDPPVRRPPVLHAPVTLSSARDSPDLPVIDSGDSNHKELSVLCGTIFGVITIIVVTVCLAKGI